MKKQDTRLCGAHGAGCEGAQGAQDWGLERGAEGVQDRDWVRGAKGCQCGAEGGARLAHAARGSRPAKRKSKEQRVHVTAMAAATTCSWCTRWFRRRPHLYGQSAPQSSVAAQPPTYSDAALLHSAPDDGTSSTISLQHVCAGKAERAQAETPRARPRDAPVARDAASSSTAEVTPGAPFVSSTVARALTFPVNILQSPAPAPGASVVHVREEEEEADEDAEDIK